MSNPNSFGGGSEIDGQVGMDEWIKNNEDQEISSRVGRNLRTISQAQSLELLDSFESQIKDAEGKLDDLDQMRRRSREFEMMRDAIAVRRKELIPDGIVVAESDNVISSQGAEDIEIDAIENRALTNDDSARATKIISKDGRVIGYARVARDKKNEEEITDELFNEKAKQESIDELSDEEAKDDKAEQIAALEAQLKEVADARKRAKEEGDYDQEAFYNSQYADIVAQIADLKHEATEESLEEAKDDKAEQIAALEAQAQKYAKLADESESRHDIERSSMYRALFNKTLDKIDILNGKIVNNEVGGDVTGVNVNADNKSEDLTGIDSIEKTGTETVDDNSENVEDTKSRKIDREYRAWQAKQIMEYKGLSDDDRKYFKTKIASDEDFSGINWDNDVLVNRNSNNPLKTEESDTEKHDRKEDENVELNNETIINGGSEKDTKRGINEETVDTGPLVANPDTYAEDLVKELEDDYVDELVSSSDYSAPNGIRAKYLNEIVQVVKRYDAMYAKFHSSEFRNKFSEDHPDYDYETREKIISSLSAKIRDEMEKSISDLKDRYALEMRNLNEKIVHSKFNRIIGNSSDDISADMAIDSAIATLDEFFSDRRELTESSGSGIGIDIGSGSGDSIDMFNLDKFYKTNRGLEVLFNASSSYDEAIDALEKSYLEGKALNEVGGILENVLQKRGEGNQFDGLMKKLRRRYEDLGLGDDGAIRSEKSVEKISWRKKAANAIRKALKMEVR